MLLLSLKLFLNNYPKSIFVKLSFLVKKTPKNLMYQMIFGIVKICTLLPITQVIAIANREPIDVIHVSDRFILPVNQVSPFILILKNIC
jgi:hypothetical protein